MISLYIRKFQVIWVQVEIFLLHYKNELTKKFIRWIIPYSFKQVLGIYNCSERFFCKYNFKKSGLFLIHTGKFSFAKGWISSMLGWTALVSFDKILVLYFTLIYDLIESLSLDYCLSCLWEVKIILGDIFFSFYCFQSP